MSTRIELSRAQLEELDQMIIDLEAKKGPADVSAPVICISCVTMVITAGAWRERGRVDQQRLAEAKAKLDAAGSGPVVSLEELRALRGAAVPTRG